MNTNDLSGIMIVKIMKLQNNVRKQITTLPESRRKLAIGTTSLERSKKLYIL